MAVPRWAPRISMFWRTPHTDPVNPPRGGMGHVAALVCLLLAFPGAALAQAVKVAVSIHPLALLVQEVGGDRVTVTTLLKPGVSPHGFEPSPAQVRGLSGADLFVSVGAGLDPWAERMAVAVRKGRPHLILAGHVPLRDAADEPGHGDGHDHAEGDPHFWLDPVLVRDHVVPALAAALTQAAPDHGDEFARRAGEVAARLSGLNDEIARALAPFAGRAFVAFHGPWAYFAERYGLNQVAVVEPIPGREPSARWMMQVVTAARRAGARAVLIEPQFNPRAAYTVAGQFHGRVVTVDEIGMPGTVSGESYAALMRFNTAAFVEAFGP